MGVALKGMGDKVEKTASSFLAFLFFGIAPRSPA